MKKLLVLVLSLALLLALAACTPGFWRESTSAKPVIYLYPEEKQDETCDAKPVAYLYPQTETEITVRLDYDGELTCTYPAYADGWTVSARGLPARHPPDARTADGREKIRRNQPLVFLSVSIEELIL